MAMCRNDRHCQVVAQFSSDVYPSTDCILLQSSSYEGAVRRRVNQVIQETIAAMLEGVLERPQFVDLHALKLDTQEILAWQMRNDPIQIPNPAGKSHQQEVNGLLEGSISTSIVRTWQLQ